MTAEFQIRCDDGQQVTGRIYSSRERMGATLLLGHGAGADQSSDFITGFAAGLARRGIDVMTFNFLYTEQGRRAPDQNEKLESVYVAAIRAARGRKRLSENILFIGGKSLGGRIASQVAAAGVERLAGLVYLGYPLHPPGKPEKQRAEHLGLIRAPMLFVQGSRDPFGTPGELRVVIKERGLKAEIHVIESGDHSFCVPKSSPVSQEEVLEAARDRITRWVVAVTANR
jgi:predicted alpha/beta-hydrolase family hydrolase